MYVSANMTVYIQDEEDEMYAVFATVLLKSMNHSEKLDGEKKEDKLVQQWIVKSVLYIPASTVLSVTVPSDFTTKITPTPLFYSLSD
jgi:hypothetical protein